MNPTSLLLATFILSIVGLFAFIWSLRKGLFDVETLGSKVIFTPEDIGHYHDPAADPHKIDALNIQTGRRNTSHHDIANRPHDHSSTLPCFVLFGSAVFWLVFASLAGLVSSYKLHNPDFLTHSLALTFGVMRTIHLNLVAYGWAPLGVLGLAMWMLPRLLRTSLVGGRFAIAGAVVWNIALIAGITAIANGKNAGMEWLEIPWQIGVLFALGGMMIGLSMVFTLFTHKVHHLYVSVWYIGAALFWFPVLYIVAKMPGVHFGIEQATTNWWFAHNVLGLFYTPLSIAAVYYFLPKVIGRPVHSYNLSLLGFWTLAFFYGQVGAHHLIGGPVPEWLLTLSIVQSMMMLIPVVAFSLNQHLTLKGHFQALKHSPTLRFIVFGAMMYTLASVQGSFEALRSFNAVTHFTHFTVAHAHLGMYGFVSMVIFGGIYFVLPQILKFSWPYPKLISWHFWLVVAGFSVYMISLMTAGILQGLALQDASKPFMDSVTVTLPWLKGRSLGGSLMVAGHLVFAFHFASMVVFALATKPFQKLSLTTEG